MKTQKPTAMKPEMPKYPPVFLGVEDTLPGEELLAPKIKKHTLADYCAHVDAFVRQGLGNLYVVRGYMLHPESVSCKDGENQKCVTDDPDGVLVRLLEYAVKRGLYTMTIYTAMTRPVVAALKRRCGKYYLGNDLGEVTSFTPPPGQRDMREAARIWVQHIRRIVNHQWKLGQPHVTCTTNNLFVKYCAECGMDIPMAEIFNIPCVDIPYAQLRGTARAYHRDFFGGWIAAGWYAGGNQDPLKPGRCRLAYSAGFLHGANIFVNESGHWGLGEFYTPRFEKEDHPLCQKYRRILKEFYQFTQTHPRPAEGPQTAIGIVHGLYDGYNGYPGNIWGQPGWAPNAHDHSWELLNVFYPETGQVGCMHGAQDRRRSRFSGTPYGLVDIIPAEALPASPERYRSLLYLGWNVMTDRQYRDLIRYVRAGGRLVMWAAHLNGSAQHDRTHERQQFYRRGDFRELFGVRIRMPRFRPSRIFCSPRFAVNTIRWIRPGVYRFPVGKRYYSTWPHGGVESRSGANVRVLAVTDHGDPFITEHSLGKGQAILVHCYSPQGHGDYRELPEDIFHAVGRREQSSFRVEGNARLAYAVYGSDRQRTLYVLNTRLDRVERGIIRGLSLGPQKIRLAPTELLTIPWS